MADLRVLLEEVFDELAVDDKETIKQFVREAFTLERQREVWVPIEVTQTFKCKCGKTTTRTTKKKVSALVPIPDYRERARAIDLLLTQAKGKPRETVKHELNLGIRQLDELTLDELDAEEARLLAAHPELEEPS